jgi:hypothetical protein
MFLTFYSYFACSIDILVLSLFSPYTFYSKWSFVCFSYLSKVYSFFFIDYRSCSFI